MSFPGRASPDGSPRGPAAGEPGREPQGAGAKGHVPRDMRQSELSTPPSEPQLTPRRLALADAIAALRGDGPPAALLRPDSEVSTPRAESTLDEVPGGPSPITGTIEAARFPQIARGTYDIAGKFAQ